MTSYKDYARITPEEFLERVNYTNFLGGTYGYELDLKKLIKNTLPSSISLIREENLNDIISGYIKYNEQDDKFTIGYNSKHSTNRKRFTIAHELGHFVLHQNITKGNIDGIEDNTMFRSNISNRYEQQANYFASRILMPTPLINKYIDSGLTRFVPDIAKAFGVSVTAMSIRLNVPY